MGKGAGEMMGKRGGRMFCCYCRACPLYYLCSRGNLHIIKMTSHIVTYLLMRFIFRKPILVIILTAFLLLQSFVHIACSFYLEIIINGLMEAIICWKF